MRGWPGPSALSLISSERLYRGLGFRAPPLIMVNPSQNGLGGTDGLRDRGGLVGGSQAGPQAVQVLLPAREEGVRCRDVPRDGTGRRMRVRDGDLLIIGPPFTWWHGSLRAGAPAS